MAAASDIRPENVILDKYGNLRFVDFGLLKEYTYAHDLVRGLFTGIETQYPMLFDTFRPYVIDLLQEAVSAFPYLQRPDIKLLAEVVYNNDSRIVFTNHAENRLKICIIAGSQTSINAIDWRSDKGCQ